MPTKKIVSQKKGSHSVDDLYGVLEKAEGMKKKLFARMQTLLDKKKVENLKHKMDI